MAISPSCDSPVTCPSFEPFTLIYYMNGLNMTVPELHGLLKQVEESLRKTPSHVMTIQKSGKKNKRFTKAKKPEEDSWSE